MTAKNRLKMNLKKAVFGLIFAFMAAFMPFCNVFVNSENVYAEPETSENITEVEDSDEEITEEEDSEEESSGESVTATTGEVTTGDSCQSSLGVIGWLVCPTTGKIAEAVDWLYDKIETILIVNPVSFKEGTPIYEIWKYCRGITNFVFIIFLLVVIYSQITGIGISNYGIKKTLPKLIIAAVLVNLSFLICTLAVDLSNIIGNSLRDIFTTVEENIVFAGSGVESISSARLYTALAGGTAVAVGAGVVAFELGAIWMLIPVLLGALVAVVTGLITIALRQAVVMLLIMISPLAMVANMLPNTEQWFKKWRDLLYKMLIFYPAFSLLFGASSLAGFAIIASASSGFGVILGVAVQIFPLFFSWKLMQMSGTFLSEINARLRGLADRPLAASRSWAESHRNLTRAKTLSSANAYTPSAKLMQFLSDRKIRREEETKKHNEVAGNRGLAKYALSHYRRDGNISRSGMAEYNLDTRNSHYKRIIAMDDNNFNRGLSGYNNEYKGDIAKLKRNFRDSTGGYLSRIGGVTLEDRLKRLDEANIDASDDLKSELARGAKIEFDNAKSYQDRMTRARFAHDDHEALQAGNMKHQFHPGVLEDSSNLARYERVRKIMEGNPLDTNFVFADAAHTFSSQAQIMKGKFNDFFNYTPATRDVINTLNSLTMNKDSNNYIDSIVSGLKTLNLRGDTDEIEKQLRNVLEGAKVELGTYTSQSLANFLMFDVKGTHPYLRRFGKYINLETAKMFNEDDPEERRTRKDVSFDEYVNGEYIDKDADGNVIYDENGNPKKRYPKKPMKVLLNGTSFKDVERPTFENTIESIRKSSMDEDANGNKTYNHQKFMDNQKNAWDSSMANIISDQFAYLSGSEQINALGRAMNFVNPKTHMFDWNGVFGEDIAGKLTKDEKKAYINFVAERTKTFLGGHVPSQIARSKTDMLASIRNEYALLDAMENDPDFLEKACDPNFKMSDEEYKAFEAEHMDGIKERFVGSFKEDALKGFVKMHHKGYQGEAKDGLIQLLNPDELYKQYFPNGENGNRNRRSQQRVVDDVDDEDDGMPVDFDDGGAGATGPIYSDDRAAIEDIYRSYNGKMGASVNEFWNEIKHVIANSKEITGKEAFYDNIENSLPQYTDVSTLYADIINGIFGGFGN